jgi:hypothetical protein
MSRCIIGKKVFQETIYAKGRAEEDRIVSYDFECVEDLTPQ